MDKVLTENTLREFTSNKNFIYKSKMSSFKIKKKIKNFR